MRLSFNTSFFSSLYYLGNIAKGRKIRSWLHKKEIFDPFKTDLKTSKKRLDFSHPEVNTKNCCGWCWSKFLPLRGCPRQHSFLQGRVRCWTKVSHNLDAWWLRSESSGRSCSSCCLAPMFQSCCSPCWSQKLTHLKSGTAVCSENTAWILYPHVHNTALYIQGD
jgi:hypothetical protein